MMLQLKPLEVFKMYKVDRVSSGGSTDPWLPPQVISFSCNTAGKVETKVISPIEPETVDN